MQKPLTKRSLEMLNTNASVEEQPQNKAEEQRAKWRAKYHARKARDPTFLQRQRDRRKIPRKKAPRPRSPASIARERERNAKRYAANRESKIQKVVARQRERYSQDPAYMIRIRLRSRIRYAVRAGRAQKHGKCADLIGCTAAELVTYIESLFLPGMNWGNKHMWHIDHVIPVSAFDMTCPDSQKAAFHYSNLRPMWAEDNRAKSAKVPAAQKHFAFGYVALADKTRARARKGD